MPNPQTEQEIKRLEEVLNNYRELLFGLEEALICATDVPRKFELKHQVGLLKKFTDKLSDDIEALRKEEISPAECKKYNYKGGFNNAYIISIIRPYTWEDIDILHNVPFRDCTYFVGREKELEQLRVQLEAKNQILISPAISVSGSGGIGKTQLAIKYFYNYAKYYDIVCWVDASEKVFQSNYAELTILFDLPERRERDINKQMLAVKRALQTKYPSTLLILDNVEDTDIIQDWLPNSRNCQIILTSRKRGILNLDEIDLPLLPLNEAIKLLCSRHPDLDKESEEAKETAERLACLPLALDIAAHYLGKHKGISLAKYQIALEKRGLEHPSQHKPKNYTSFTKHQDRAVYATIMESCNTLEFDASKELLQYICWCYPEDIPLDWLEDAANFDEIDFDEAISELFEYNLLLVWNEDKNLINTHLLINEVIRLELLKNKPKLANNYLNPLLENFEQHFSPSEGHNPLDYRSWEHQDRYGKQAFMMLSEEKYEEYYNNKQLIARLNNRVGLYIQNRLRYNEAEILYRKALEIRQKVLGEEHPGTAMSINNLAYLLQTTGRYEEAEPFCRKALEINQKVLGEEHPDTAMSINNLAELLKATGRYEEAESFCRKALKIYKKVLGEEHPDTAGSINNLAGLFQVTGRYEEAEPFCRKALEIYKKVLGEEHPDTTKSINNLSYLLQDTGRYEEAELLYRKALKIRKKVLGEEHPDTATSINNLATLLQATGRYEEAEPLFRKALKIRKNVLGEEHPSTTLSINNLATLLQETGRYEEAEPLYIKALEIRKKVLGEEHPDTAQSINNLALLFQIRGRYEEAEPLYRKALTIRKKVLGEKHPDTATSINNLAILLQATGHYKEAEPLYRKALEIYKKVLGEKHPDIASIINNLAELLKATGRYTEAEPLYLQAMKIYELSYGVAHPSTAIAYCNLALFWLDQEKNIPQVLPLMERVYRIFYHKLGAEHPNTKRVQSLIAQIPPSTFQNLNSPPDENWSLLSEEWGV